MVTHHVVMRPSLRRRVALRAGVTAEKQARVREAARQTLVAARLASQLGLCPTIACIWALSEETEPHFARLRSDAEG
jgi:hypothetical protein